MRTLFEIMRAVMEDEEPAYDELFYALVVYSELHMLAQSILHGLSTGSMHAELARVQALRSLNSWSAALDTAPVEWIGTVKGVEHVEIRKLTVRIMERIVQQYGDI